MAKKWTEETERPEEDKGMIARFFHFNENGTNFRREVTAGVTTFLAMAYILFVNPSILSEAGMPEGAVFTATALSAIIGCLLMALVANYPVAIAPSMGLNAFFAFSVVIGMGVPWQTALVGVLFSGIIFVIITLLKLREMILNAIPHDLKMASASGIGLFIAFIGFKNAGIVVTSKATLVTLGDLTSPGTLLTIFGLVISVILMVRKVPGAIFFGMVLTGIVGVLTGVLPTPTNIISAAPSLDPIFGVSVTQMFTHPDQVFTTSLIGVVLTFLFVEFFDTAGTLMGIATQAGLIKDNQMVRGSRALLADSSSIIAGGLLGTSPTTSYIESSSGVASGGRTGFTSVVTAALFVLALLFSPLLTVVTGNVTAPALIIVGVLMASSLGKIQWDKFELAVPAFLAIIIMPLTYSIANGIALGLVMYPITMVVKGRARELHPIMYGLFVVFILYFAFLA
ncbi:MAG TPA: NCS2 family permease [Bacillales bacterium]|nr:NCS2 family permease [Bacillales bacterium]